MEKPLILIVDDERNYADEITTVISETERYATATAYSAMEALEYLRNNKIMFGLGGNRVRVIVLDIKMPEMDGLQFLEKVRKEYGPDIGIIMLTAWEDEEKWEKATNGCVINYITKPYERDNLIGTIDRFCQGLKEEGKLIIETFERHIEKREKGFKKDQG